MEMQIFLDLTPDLLKHDLGQGPQGGASAPTNLQKPEGAGDSQLSVQ